MSTDPKLQHQIQNHHQQLKQLDKKMQRSFSSYIKTVEDQQQSLLMGQDSKQHYHNILNQNAQIWCKNEKKAAYGKMAGDAPEGGPVRISEEDVLQPEEDKARRYGHDGGKRFRDMQTRVHKKFRMIQFGDSPN